MSSKRRIRRRSCEGKIRHRDSFEATSHVKGLGGFPYHVYKCKFCKGYHVGRYNEHTIFVIKNLSRK